MLRLLPSMHISCFTFFSNHCYLAVGGLAGEVALLDINSGARTHVDHACKIEVKRLTWSPDGKQIAIECNNDNAEREVTIWSWKNGCVCGPGVRGYGAAWSPDSTKIVPVLKQQKRQGYTVIFTNTEMILITSGLQCTTACVEPYPENKFRYNQFLAIS